MVFSNLITLFLIQIYPVLVPEKRENTETQILSNRKPIMLALNIPTFINLYGYGYRNIYELDELVHINDPRIEFEGTEVTLQ